MARRRKREEPSSPPPEATEAERVSRHTDQGSLGYAEDAGHPGGEPDLDAKTDWEGEGHDETR